MYNDLPILSAGEIPGAQSWNAVSRLLRNLHSVSDELSIRRAADGSLEFELNTSALSGSGELFNFKATVSETTLSIASGKVIMPDGTASVSAYTGTAVSGRCFWLELTKSNSTYSASWDYGTAYPDFYDLTNMQVNIPMLAIASVSGVLTPRYSHLGNVIFEMTPYILIDEFDKTSQQTLDHDSDGKLVWTDYGVCS